MQTYTGKGQWIVRIMQYTLIYIVFELELAISGWASSTGS